MAYLAVYRALVNPAPIEFTSVAQGADYLVQLHPGPLEIPRHTAGAAPDLPHAALDFHNEKASLPVGPYVLMQVRALGNSGVIGAGWDRAHDRFAQIVAMLDLELPGVVHEKVYEGTVGTRGNPMHIEPEGGLRFGERSYPAERLATILRSGGDCLGQLSEQDAARFALAARWFRRATDSANLIDRVLFYWIVLEVYPTGKGNAVPHAVARFIAERVYPHVPEKEVKGRLQLGRIFGFRSRIVHHGKTSIATQEEWVMVTGYVDRLQAITRTCLRILMGLPAGNDLDQFVLGNGGADERTD